MSRLAILANQPTTPEATKAYSDYFAEELARVGEARFSAAVTNCLHNRHGNDQNGHGRFYPQFEEFRSQIPNSTRIEIDQNCESCGGTGFERCRHCDCRKRQLTDTGLDGEPDPSCPVCRGRGSIVDENRRLNNRVRSCACKRVVAA